ncbi:MULTISPECIES: hypothetical protein [unclassified Bradyrhizobium]|uniref:hypothetical protein n=1 Tax=unclassified Bradyrhizobium TaxID=2631580 RepID=UPI002915DCD0|nr:MULTISPECIES: hypothetical protein [unclassified Bradyrhizobium]
MPPAKKPPARRRRPPVAIASATDGAALVLLLGQLDGKLESHIEAVQADRAEREADRAAAAQYRHDVRNQLQVLDRKIDAVGDHAGRIKALETSAADFKAFRNKLAGAVLVFGAFWSLGLAYLKDWLLKKVT